MSSLEKNSPSHRKMAPADFVARWQHGKTLQSIRKTLNDKDWKNYLDRWGITAEDANNRIRIAEFLSYDPDRIWQIALLRLPYDIVVRVCSKRFTNEQRERWFALYSQSNRRDDLISQKEAWDDFQSIVNPPELFTEVEGKSEEIIVSSSLVLSPDAIQPLVEQIGNMEFVLRDLRQAVEDLIAKS